MQKGHFVTIQKKQYAGNWNIFYAFQRLICRPPMTNRFTYFAPADFADENICLPTKKLGQQAQTGLRIRKIQSAVNETGTMHKRGTWARQHKGTILSHTIEYFFHIIGLVGFCNCSVLIKYINLLHVV